MIQRKNSIDAEIQERSFFPTFYIKIQACLKENKKILSSSFLDGARKEAKVPMGCLRQTPPKFPPASQKLYGGQVTRAMNPVRSRPMNSIPTGSGQNS